MKYKLNIRTATALAVASSALLAICGCATAPITHGIPNLALVEPGVWRGGQPNAEGWAWLKSQGVIFDLKLNSESEASDALAQTNGLHICRFPITLEQQTIGKPRYGQIIGAVSCMSAGYVFVHCEHGQDRTGLIVAAYRVKYNGWSKQKAESEMMAHGFHPWLRGLYWAWHEDVK